jgi:hypothetical protein
LLEEQGATFFQLNETRFILQNIMKSMLDLLKMVNCLQEELEYIFQANDQMSVRRQWSHEKQVTDEKRNGNMTISKTE